MGLIRDNQLALLLTTLLLLCSCAVTPLPQAVSVDPGATLHLYLQPMPQEAHPLTITVAGLSARTLDGRDIPLLLEPWVFEPRLSIGRQVRLLQKKLPVGEYAGLNLELATATLQTEEGPMDLLVDNASQFIERSFSIKGDQALALFLSLAPERLITGGYQLTPRFSVWQAQSPLPELKGIVSHPHSGLLTLFEKKTPAVFAVKAVGHEPSGVALDQARRLAYLALTAENSISVFDLVRDKVQRKIRLHTAARPTELVLSANGETLVSVNSGTNSVSLFETRSLLERQRLVFSTSPAAVFNSAHRRRVYVALPDANALAVIDLDRAAVAARIDLAEPVFQGAADRGGRELYLLAENSPNLLVFDADALTISRRIPVGYGARCLAVNHHNGLVYVGMKSGEVAVVDPQAGFPIDSFRGDRDVVDLTVDLEENSLLVVTGKGQLLEKYDLISKKRLATLELGASSFAVHVMGER